MSLVPWDASRQFPRDRALIWKAIESKRPCAFCRIEETEYRDYIPGIGSIMVCPIFGKAKTIGAIVVADKEGGQEFFSQRNLTSCAERNGISIDKWHFKWHN